MRFVQPPVLPIAKILPLRKVAKSNVRRAAPAKRVSYRVEKRVYPLNSAAAFTMTSTITLVNYFFPLETVKKNASAIGVER